ncbi:MAG TPA: hypothetical protein VMV18_10370 [bacterium]|nr:hypothetical protein [bacterium]
MARARPRQPEPPPALVEMAQMWDGVAVRTVLLERTRRALTIGESHACDFFAPVDRFDPGAESFAIVERVGAEIHVRLVAGVTARVERGGRTLSGAELLATGLARRDEATGESRLRLLPDARVTLDVGGLQFVLQRVRAGRFDLRAALGDLDPRLAGALSLAFFCGYGAIAIAVVYAAAQAMPDLTLPFLHRAPPEVYTRGPEIELRMVLKASSQNADRVGSPLTGHDPR